MDDIIKKITDFFFYITDKLDNFQEKLRQKYAVDIPIKLIVGGVILFIFVVIFIKIVLGTVGKILFGS